LGGKQPMQSEADKSNFCTGFAPRERYGVHLSIHQPWSVKCNSFAAGSHTRALAFLGQAARSLPAPNAKYV
jgi:hypothetical protein